MVRAVLDANTFVCAVLSPKGNPAKILDAWHDGRFHLVVSNAILKEMRRVFLYPKIAKRHGWSKGQLGEFLDDVAHLSVLAPGDLHLQIIEEDPSDDCYLECAVESDADFIVSGDHHLLDLGEYEGIWILNPKTFLNILQEE